MKISCRAQVAPDCLNGEEEEFIYEDGAEEDGTYDEATGTVVCDTCYLMIMPYTPSGRGLLDELNDAIGYLRIQTIAA